MPNYHHFDHLDRFAPGVKLGTYVRKGQLAGYCGKTGTTSPHCHYEVMKNRPANWLQYVWGWTRAKVLERYLDPSPWITDEMPMRWNKLGYDFLSPIVSADGRKGFHPGKDLNYGSGNMDLGFPVYFTCDGIIEYVGDKKIDGGAGNNIWWSQHDPAPVPSNPLIDITFGKAHAGTFFLSVEEHGEAWFVTREGTRQYIGATAEAMLDFVKTRAVGITKADLNRIPIAA